MLRNAHIYEAFKRQQIRDEPLDYERNMRIFEAMYSYARQMGALEAPRTPADLEADIRLARALNDQGTTQNDRAGTE